MPLSVSLVLLVVQALLIVGLSRALGVVARGLRQPMVIAEIVAGIALGPSLLGRVWPSASAVAFPPQSTGALGVVSQFGLILFMFTIGVEFDPKLLRGRSGASIAISHTSILVPFVLGAVLARATYGSLAGHAAAPIPFTLFLGAAMSVTAFPVLARILAEQGLVHTRVGAVALACAAVDDVTAWCILAFVVAVARYSGVGHAVMTTALAAAYVAFLALVVRPAFQGLARRATPNAELSENQIALVWFAALLSASITEWIGIHALFGAFALGVMVPDTNDFARKVANKTGHVVVVLLLPLFFAYSGLRTQIGLLSTAGDWAICSLIVLVACIGKFGGTALAARLTGTPFREAAALGILMNTRGLMELVILNVGLDLGVISNKLFAMMVIMALVTTFMTSPVLRWLCPALDVAAPDGVADSGDKGLRHAT